MQRSLSSVIVDAVASSVVSVDWRTFVSSFTHLCNMNRLTICLINWYGVEINLCVIVTINRSDRRRKRRLAFVLIRAAVSPQGVGARCSFACNTIFLGRD